MTDTGIVQHFGDSLVAWTGWRADAPLLSLLRLWPWYLLVAPIAASVALAALVWFRIARGAARLPAPRAIRWKTWLLSTGAFLASLVVTGLLYWGYVTFRINHLPPIHETQSLWKSDGTSEGTALVARLPERGPSAWTDPVAGDGRLFFFLGSGETHVELWTSDGTEPGTRLVKDLSPGRAGPAIVVGGTLFFAFDDPLHGDELWRSDGTATGTALVLDFVPGADGSAPRGLTEFGGGLAFVVGMKATGFRSKTFIEPGLWITDGTSEGTTLLKSGPVGLNSLRVETGVLYFLGDRELWQSDGTATGTRPLAEVAVGRLGPCSSIGPDLLVAGNAALRRWEVTGPSGSGRLRELAPLFCPTSYARLARQTMFTLQPLEGSGELWITDGTAPGTKLVRRFSTSLGPLISVGRLVLFGQRSDETGYELWRTDGTADGTFLITDAEPGPESALGDHRVNLGDRVLYNGLHGVWATDGTAGGTRKLQNVSLGSGFAALENHAFWLTRKIDFGPTSP